jgi:hypothetical protein
MATRVTYESLREEIADHLTDRHGIGTLGASLPQLDLRHAEAHICGDFYGKPAHEPGDRSPIVRAEAEHKWVHVGAGFDRCVNCERRVKCDSESGLAHVRDTQDQHSTEQK